MRVQYIIIVLLIEWDSIKEAFSPVILNTSVRLASHSMKPLNFHAHATKRHPEFEDPSALICRIFRKINVSGTHTHTHTTYLPWHRANGMSHLGRMLRRSEAKLGLVRQLDADAASAHGDGLTGPGPWILSETGSGAAGGRHSGGAAPVLPRCRGALSLRPSVPPSLVLRYN